MLQQIKQWFEPPTFPDNEEKNHPARLPAIDADTVVKMVSRVHLKLAEHPELPIHLSLGSYTTQQGRLSEAFIIADQRMYTSKAERKQRPVR